MKRSSDILRSCSSRSCPPLPTSSKRTLVDLSSPCPPPSLTDEFHPQITGPPPTSRSSSHTTPTSTPLPTPTPLPAFALPVPDRDGKPLYVPGSQAERQARMARMSTPLRRGTHESWWTAERSFFNAVAKVCRKSEPQSDGGMDEELTVDRLSRRIVSLMKKDIWYEVQRSHRWVLLKHYTVLTEGRSPKKRLWQCECSFTHQHSGIP